MTSNELAEYVEHIEDIGDLTLDDLSRPIRTEVCHYAGWQDCIVRTSRSQEPGRRTSFRPRLPEETLKR